MSLKNTTCFIPILLILLSSLQKFCFANEGDKIRQLLSPDNKGIKTDVLLVYKNGERIFEYLGRGYGLNTKHLSWSMAKTVTGILIGQAVREGKLKFSDKVSQYLPAIKSEATILDLLQMSSGIEFNEEYFGIPVTADVTKMLYLKEETQGAGEYVLSLKNRDTFLPGDHFYYSSGDSNLLMLILKKVMPSVSDYNDYPWKNFFKPLGIKNATFERDVKGVFIGSSYIYATPLDFVKMGTLLMEKGRWKDQRIIPEEYFELMNTVAPGVQKIALEGTSATRSYSVHITTNKPIPGRQLPSEYLDLPEDALLMLGHQGQFVIASPSEKVVIVRLAMDKGKIDRHSLFEAISQFIKSKGHSYRTVRDTDPARKVTNANSSKPKKKTKLKDYLLVPRLMKSLAAKEYCSCIFITKRSKEWCRDDLKSNLPVLPILWVNKKSQTVTAMYGTGLQGLTSKAKYLGDKFGCTLVKNGNEQDLE